MLRNPESSTQRHDATRRLATPGTPPRRHAGRDAEPRRPPRPGPSSPATIHPPEAPHANHSNRTNERSRPTGSPGPPSAHTPTATPARHRPVRQPPTLTMSRGRRPPFRGLDGGVEGSWTPHQPERSESSTSIPRRPATSTGISQCKKVLPHSRTPGLDSSSRTGTESPL